jgi:hypothetical protein
MKKKKIIKKYLTGVQAIETPQADFPDSGDFLKQGIATAAASGNPLLAGTSLLAGGVGELVNQATMPKRKELLMKRKLNASTQNQALAVNQGMDVNAAVQYNRLNPGTEFIAEDGLIVPNQSLIEVEKNELIFRKVGSKTKLIADFQNGKLHNEGGEDYVAQEGDIIMPKAKRKKIMNMVDKSSGFVIDKLRFDREVNKLPKDKDKAALGTIVGAGLNLGGQLLSNITQAADLGEGRSQKLARKFAPIGDVTSLIGSSIVGLSGLGSEIDSNGLGEVDELGNPIEPTKFASGGEVKKKDKVRTRVILDDGTSRYISVDREKGTQAKKKLVRSTPIKYQGGGLVGKDGQPIIDPVDQAIAAGEKLYYDYNNQTPSFTQEIEPNPYAPKLLNAPVTPMSQDLPRKFGKSAQVATNPNQSFNDPLVGPVSELLPEQQTTISNPQKKFFLDTYASNLNDPRPRVGQQSKTGLISNMSPSPIRPKFRNERYTTTNKGQGLTATAGIDESGNSQPIGFSDPNTGELFPFDDPNRVSNKVNEDNQLTKDGLPIDQQKKKKTLNLRGVGSATANIASALITKENAKPEVRDSDLLEAEHLTAIDTGDPDRQAALMNKEGAKRFRRNAGGGNIQQVTSAMSADDQEYLNQVNRVNAQQADKFQQVQNQNVQIDNAVNQYNTDRTNLDIDINDANRAAARNIKRSFRSNFADAAQQTKVDTQVAQKDANLEAENIRANALKAGVAEQQHQEVMKAIETKRQYDQGSLELMSKANPQADVNLRKILIERFGLTDDQADVYIHKGAMQSGINRIGGGNVSSGARKFKKK